MTEVTPKTEPVRARNGDIVNGKVIDLRVDKEYRTVGSTILLLFKSRRFLVLISAIITSVIISLIPELAPLQEHLPAIIISGLGLILSIGVEDAINAWNSNKDSLPKDLRGLIEETSLTLINEVLEEAFGDKTENSENENTAED